MSISRSLLPCPLTCGRFLARPETARFMLHNPHVSVTPLLAGHIHPSSGEASVTPAYVSKRRRARPFVCAGANTDNP